MSGIAAIVNGGPNASSIIDEMINIIRHRGPDCCEKLCDEWIALGHARLHTLGRHPRSDQSLIIQNESLAVVLDGEIYNYKELKRTLTSYPYRTERNAEIIIAAYQKWGTKCLHHFEGMFSFILYDYKRRIVFAARDHFGIKPLYYTEQGSKLLMASEVKSLLTQMGRVEANNSAIIEYWLTSCAEHRRETFFQGVQQLMPGEAFTYSGNTMSLFRYYDLKDHVYVDYDMSEERANENFLEVLTICVAESLQSVEKAGVLYSGGLDSSSLIACTNRLSNNILIQAFTSISNDSNPDEILIFKSMLQEFGVPEKFCNTEFNDADAVLRRSMWHLEMPFPLSSLCYDILSRTALDDGIVILLHGQAGGAVQAGGLFQYPCYLLDLFLKGNWASFLQGMKAWRPKGKGGALWQFSRALARHWAPTIYHRYKAQKNVLLKYFNQDLLSQVEFRDKLYDDPFNSVLENVTYVSMYATKQPRLLRVLDRFGQAYAREVRMAYMDHRLVEFLWSVPIHHKIQEGVQKLLVKNSMKGLIPEFSLKAPKNSFMQEHLSSQTKTLMEQEFKMILSSPSARQRGIYNPELFLQLRQPSEMNLKTLSKIGQIELWHQIFIDTNPQEASAFGVCP